jgi:HEAT repeat protein
LLVPRAHRVSDKRGCSRARRRQTAYWFSDQRLFRYVYSRIEQTVVWRAKRDGLLRNVAVALGNSGNPEAVPALVRALAADPSALVRAHAAWALGRLGGAGARRALDGARRDPDPTVVAEVESALG